MIRSQRCLDGVGAGPEIHRRADELGAVVAIDPLRQPPFEADRSSVATTSRPQSPCPIAMAKHSVALERR
jgi:hypothetical protein